MTIRDVLHKVGKSYDLSDEEIEKGFNFADATAGQGDDIKEQLNRELSDEEAKMFESYATIIIAASLVDPHIRDEVAKVSEEAIRKN